MKPNIRSTNLRSVASAPPQPPASTGLRATASQIEDTLRAVQNQVEMVESALGLGGDIQGGPADEAGIRTLTSSLAVIEAQANDINKRFGRIVEAL